MKEVISVLALAVFVEGTVEYLFAALFKRYNITEFLKYVAVFLGIFACIGYQVDVFTVLGLSFVAVSPIVSYIVSGVLIGRGSNVINDLVDLMGSGPVAELLVTDDAAMLTTRLD